VLGDPRDRIQKDERNHARDILNGFAYPFHNTFRIGAPESALGLEKGLRFVRMRNRMLSVNKRPIGVRFLALLILIVSAWFGRVAGTAFAHVWVSAHRQRTGERDASERSHLNAVIPVLDTIQRLQAATTVDPENPGSSLFREIGKLKDLKGKPNLQDVRPVVDLELGLAHIEMAVEEEKARDPGKSHVDIQLAEDLFHSLGWRDCSEQTLKAVAQEERRKRALLSGRAITK
jgi:hypothetical protein